VQTDSYHVAPCFPFDACSEVEYAAEAEEAGEEGIPGKIGGVAV